MKEFGNNIAKLFFIIMVMIALAVSTATLSQWASPETSANGGGGEGVVQSETAPALSASVTP
ncbi:MAG TPA: hypothetical protein VER76_20340 [Pyrinomonadaceae bacterium]|nr:hypothetical protein [Pyrinomonadaceae bacterium]